MTKQSLADLKRIAIAKHGKDRAWSLALMEGNPRHKKPWQLAIAQPVQTVEEKLDHQIWQEQIKGDFKKKWENELKQQWRKDYDPRL